MDVLLKQPVVLLQTLDVQLHKMIKQEDSSEQECRPSLDREGQEPPHKEDEKRINVTLVQVKTEDQREEKPSTSNWTQHIKTESDEDNCGESEPELHTLHRDDHQMSRSSETETDDSEDWRETSNSQSGLNTEENPKRHAREKKDDAEHESLTCSRCERSFSSRVGLTLHLKSCCKSLTCWFCSKCFDNRHNLESHIKIHGGEKPFTCSHCDKCFAKRCNLKYHMRIHSGEKPFRCSKCGKKFRTNGTMKAHMRSHTGEKPYNCSQCGKCYGHISHLNTHLRIHTGEKPYVCSQCGKGFKYPGYLKTHMRSHTGEKPYICSKCGDCFKYSTCLSRHKKSATCALYLS